MASRKRSTHNDGLLKFLTETVAKHDKKLALDYQAISRLNKDTDKVTTSVGELTSAVSEMAGVMQTQSKMLNAVLAVTVVAFLGVVVRGVAKPPTFATNVAAKEFVRMIKKEIHSQRPVAVGQAQSKTK